MKLKPAPSERSVAMLNWIRRYGGWWYLICTPGNPHLTLGLMQTILQSLAEAGLDELIFVLLMVHREDPVMEHIQEYMLLDELALRWAQDRDEVIQRLISYFE